MCVLYCPRDPIVITTSPIVHPPSCVVVAGLLSAYFSFLFILLLCLHPLSLSLARYFCRNSLYFNGWQGPQGPRRGQRGRRHAAPGRHPIVRDPRRVRGRRILGRRHRGAVGRRAVGFHHRRRCHRLLPAVGHVVRSRVPCPFVVRQIVLNLLFFLPPLLSFYLWDKSFSPNRIIVCLMVGFTVLFGVALYIEWFVFEPFLGYFTLFFGVFIGYYSVSDIYDGKVSFLVVRRVRGCVVGAYLPCYSKLHCPSQLSCNFSHIDLVSF